MKLTLSSYNIHRCYGRDGEYNPSRIREVLRMTKADVIALQEVEILRDRPGLLDYFCEDSSWTAIHGPTLERASADYGNAMLTSLPIRSLSRVDISQPGREPRGALDAVLQAGQASLRVLATHLGLWPAERRAQVRQLLNRLQAETEDSKQCDFSVLMGDLNEWFLWGRPLRLLQAHFRPARAPATFPSGYPLFALDRIWLEPGNLLSSVRTLNNPLTQIASDHLPLLARVETGTS